MQPQPTKLCRNHLHSFSYCAMEPSRNPFLWQCCRYSPSNFSCPGGSAGVNAILVFLWAIVVILHTLSYLQRPVANISIHRKNNIRDVAFQTRMTARFAVISSDIVTSRILRHIQVLEYGALIYHTGVWYVRPAGGILSLSGQKERRGALTFPPRPPCTPDEK